MSKFKEYLQLLPRALKNPGKIVEGLYTEIRFNYSSLPKEEQDEIIRRRCICEGCPFMSINAPTSEEYFEMTGHHYETKRLEKHCTGCGCPLSTRTAALSAECGLSTLNSQYPDKAVPLKWTAFKKDDSTQPSNS